MPGNMLRNNDIREYYHNTARKADIKRISRIVKQNVQKAEDPQTTAKTTKFALMSQIIKENQTRYAKERLPEERESFKISHFKKTTKPASRQMKMFLLPNILRAWQLQGLKTMRLRNTACMEQVVRDYVRPGGGHSLIWPIRGRAAGQVMVFGLLCPEQGIQFYANLS